MNTKLKALVAVTALVGASSAFAGATLTNTKGPFPTWGGFDWASNGTAVVEGFDNTIQVGDPADDFSLTYWATASTIVDMGGAIINLATLGILDNSYEYTIEAMINETATCLVASGGFCTNAKFDVTSGSFKIWYDTSPDANQVTGFGITNGDLLMSGTILAALGGGFDVIDGGAASLIATVDFTNNTFINPDLVSTNATTTLQGAVTATGWVPATSMPGVAGATQALPANVIQLQADGNQNFDPAVVPEPGTLALLGVALGGLGFVGRRKTK